MHNLNHSNNAFYCSIPGLLHFSIIFYFDISTCDVQNMINNHVVTFLRQTSWWKFFL